MPDAADTRKLAGGRYELAETLGGGSMAVVWRARDTVLGVDRAIKLLHANLSGSRTARSRFLVEAKALAKLEHPNVLRMYDVGEEPDGRLFIVTELVEGGSLRGRQLSPPDALEAVFQVLQALAIAHVRGVVHRDVKPGNVLFGADGTYRLADFGIARLQDAPQGRTRTGQALGTRGYMAPEQRDDAKSAGVAADLYGAGATLWALWAGKDPPEGFLEGPDAFRGMPTGLRDVVVAATAYKPEQRYKNAREMAQAIAQVRDAMGGEAVGARWMRRFDESLQHLVRMPAELGVTDPGPDPAPTEEATEPTMEAVVERDGGWGAVIVAVVLLVAAIGAGVVAVGLWG